MSAELTSRTLAESRIGLIGAGNMASALARGWLAAGLLPASQIAAFDLDERQLHSLISQTGISSAASNHDLCFEREIIVVATKPPVVARVLEEIAPVLVPGQLVVSIAAGVPLQAIEALLPEGVAAIRVMPNTPCLVGEGAAAYSRGHSALPQQAYLVGQLFNAVGTAQEVPESWMDAVTGLSGSGPAYIFIIIEALADGGVRMGLDRATAQKLAAQTVLGAARMVLETGEHPAKLKDQVASPGGTTIAGLAVLEDRAVRSAFIEAVGAAAARSAELNKPRD